MGTPHSDYCRKEKEIAEIHTDLRIVKKVVMGNGKGLNVTVPLLAQNVEKLDETVGDFQTALSGFVKFQENMEGQQEGKMQIRRRTRWLIGLLVGVCISLVGLLIGLISKMP